MSVFRNSLLIIIYYNVFVACAFPEFIWKKGLPLERSDGASTDPWGSCCCRWRPLCEGKTCDWSWCWNRWYVWLVASVPKVVHYFCRVNVHLIMGAANHVQARKDAVFIREHCRVVVICQIHTGCSNLCAKSMYMYDIHAKEWLQ